MLEELKKMNEELEAIRLQHLEKSKEIFGVITKNLFEKHSKLKSFSWTQYTPYFNDGDTCEFSAHTSDPLINEDEESDGNEFENEFEAEYGEYDKTTNSYPNKKQILNPKYDKDLSLALDDVTEFLENIDEDNLKQMFGDHAKIIITAGGVEVEEYDHD